MLVLRLVATFAEFHRGFVHLVEAQCLLIDAHASDGASDAVVAVVQPGTV